MKLVRLSTLSILGALLGLVILLGAVVAGLQQMRAMHAEISDLLALQKGIDDFSSASDSLLLFPADQVLWQSYLADARALQDRLRRLGATDREALEVAHRLGTVIESVAATAAPGGGEASGAAARPLELTARTRIVMSQVGGHGIALDRALDDVLRERQQGIARGAAWLTGGFAAVATLYAVVSVLAFGLIHRRLSGPSRELSRTVERIRTGDADARAEVRGGDELADLARALNQLLDQQQRTQDFVHRQQQELAYREQMLAESQGIARVGSWRLHVPEGRLEWSAETFRIVGVSPDTFTPSPEAFFARVHPDDRPRLLAEREPALLGHRSHDIGFRIVRPDGEVRHVHERAECRLDAAGQPLMFAGTIQDVTELRRAQTHLREYRELVEASADLCAVIDADYRYELVNRAYADRHGMARERIEGAHLVDILGAGYFEAVARPGLDRCLAGETQFFEAEYDYPDLGRRQLLVRYHPLTLPDRARRSVSAVITDITELKRTEAAVREKARLLDIAGRVARLGGWRVDLDTGQVIWSDVVAEIHGMPAGHSPTLEEAFALVVPEWRSRIRQLLGSCAEAGVPFDEELQIVDATGRRIWVRAVGEPVRGRGGAIQAVQGAFQDISARKAAKLTLERLAARLGHTLESITDAFFTLTQDWRFDYVNAEAERLLGRSRGDLAGRNVWAEFPEAVGTPIEREYRRAVEEQVTVGLEEYYPPLERWFDIRAYPSEDGLAVYFRDVTERYEMMRRLREQEERLRASRDHLAHVLGTRQALIDALPAHIALLDGEGNVLDLNERWRASGGEIPYGDATLSIGGNYPQLCASVDGEYGAGGRELAAGLQAVLAGARQRFSLEYPCHAPDQVRWFRAMVNRLPAPARKPGGEGGPSGAVVMHLDITERKLAERELERLAHQDALTGLPSRNGFVRALTRDLERSGWQPAAVVVLLDVRQLRDINDVHGYEAGDELLVQIGLRLDERAGAGAIAARIGGDEFAVFLPERPDAEPAQELTALAEAFEAPFELRGTAVAAGARFGYTGFGRERRSIESVLREAELALFHSRHEGTARTWSAYTAELDAAARQRIRITGELGHALRDGELQLYYQPKIDLASGRMVACEALLRWQHPRHGLQLPATFIPIAERSQLIGPIGDWALHEACRHLREWRDAGIDDVRVAVNVSLVQFTLGDFITTVQAATSAYGIGPQSLTLEITESVFEREAEGLRQRLRNLHDLGVSLSLDDFGTGYSSLRYLQQYPFDEIKIDKGFIGAMLDDAYSRRVVATVLSLAQALGAKVVAEGIETAVVRDALREMGCATGQGFYYSVPLPAHEFGDLLRRSRETGRVWSV